MPTSKRIVRASSPEMDRVKVTFYPSGQSVLVPPGATVAQAAAQAGLAIDEPCAGRGTCGRCQVRCSGGLDPPAGAEAGLLDQRALAEGIRLACLARIASDATIEIPEPSGHALASRRKAGLAAEAYLQPRPNIRKHRVPAAELSLDRTQTMLDSLLHAMAAHGFPVTTAELAALQQLGKSAGPLTAVVASNRIIAIEPGDTTNANYGVAIDLGTTTVAGYLMDLTTGQQLAAAAVPNPQRSHGEDVISRIQYAEASDGLRKLHRQAIEAVNAVVGQLVADSQIERETIYELTLAGNTAMLHLLLGISPVSLGLAPYRAVTTAPAFFPARDIGIEINPRGQVYVLPGIAGFVGADTVGVILATGMQRSSRIRLAIDLGTNGELVLGSRERLLCCATAAGPAFEGGRISRGMCAAPGAIERVLWEDGPEAVVIDNVKPRGICGSGLVDAVAGMVRRGIVSGSGRLLAPGGRFTPDYDPGFTLDRSPGFTLVEGDDTESGEPLVITQQDIRELQLAKAAVRAGIEVLKRELDVADSDISEVLLAGAFGSYVDKESAAAIGLLPGVPLDRVRAVGNAAGAGAKLALLHTGARKEVQKIAQQAQYIELSARPEFQDLFVEAMRFPGA